VEPEEENQEEEKYKDREKDGELMLLSEIESTVLLHDVFDDK
jgi:hypothetical protein